MGFIVKLNLCCSLCENEGLFVWVLRFVPKCVVGFEDKNMTKRLGRALE
ncbi:hypothetical protein THERMOT_2176 [Bathymodiolus thermophilus thioautotrophic gill symbiont]|nr:hypothetical protein THERMOT_2176 [Bathymodiolus thermophilus thioautotrophic gill symbiont]